MSERRRHTIVIGFVVLISLTLLAAPARGDDWFSLHIGGGGFGVGFGSSDWSVYGSSWSNPGWSVDSHVALAGYGEWVWVDGLGQCWRPWVRTDWRPFTHGRWVWTSWGWTWVAYEPWGYFPHHFGNWAMSPSGWVWRPGTVYSPANVVWVSAGSWFGWYPSPPRGWSHSHRGFHAGYAGGHHDGYRSGYREGAADGYWAGWDDARYATYVSHDRFGDDDLARYAVGATAVRASSSRAVPRAAVAAPDRHDLARRGVVVPEMSLERRTVRVDGRHVEIARPRGAAESIGRNARSTVERALAPAASETLSRRSIAARDGAAATPAPAVAAGRDQRARAGILRSPAPAAPQQAPSRSTSPRTGSVEQRRPAPVIRPELRVPPQRMPEERSSRGAGIRSSAPSRSSSSRIDSVERGERRTLPPVTSSRQQVERRREDPRPVTSSKRERSVQPPQLRGAAPAPASRRVESSDRRSSMSRRSEASRRAESSPSEQRSTRRSGGDDDDRRRAQERSRSQRR